MGVKTIGRFVYDSSTPAAVSANGNVTLPTSTVSNNCISCIMTNHRSEHVDMSHELQEFYDWQRTKTMNCMAEVKVLVDSYK